MIEVIDLTKSYTLGGSTVHALDHINMTIEDGEMVAITGPSGSGKPTLMNILGCLDTPDTGIYRLSGENVAGLSSDALADIRNRRIGFVFQTFNLLPRLSALENVELPLLYSRDKHAGEKAREALKIVGLEERMHHAPNQMSGGQRQRVAIARAIVTNPAMILADEPTGNLDSKTGQEILELFHLLNAEGHMIVLVTHDPDIAHECTRAIRIFDGRIVKE